MCIALSIVLFGAGRAHGALSSVAPPSSLSRPAHLSLLSLPPHSRPSSFPLVLSHPRSPLLSPAPPRPHPPLSPLFSFLLFTPLPLAFLTVIRMYSSAT